MWRLDRLGRSLGDLIQLTNELKSRDVEFESLTEKVETESPTGKLVFHVVDARAWAKSKRQITDEIESVHPHYFALTKLGFFMELPLP